MRSRGTVAAEVASWTHPVEQGMTAWVQQAIRWSGLRLRLLLLLSLFVLLLSLIG
ncbi:MAG: hypothetical protein Q9M35_00555 [Rhodothermus sp.]|nr:hypothetical protein [Rhodothermus sp.]